jgi:hypothetical protein
MKISNDSNILFFFGMINVGAAHSEEATLVSIPIDSINEISSLVIADMLLGWRRVLHKMVSNPVRVLMYYVCHCICHVCLETIVKNLTTHSATGFVYPV